MSRSRFRGLTVATGVALALMLVPAADAGKSGRNVVVKDSKDRPGSIYPSDIYKSCDIRELKATVKRGRLVVKITHSGKRDNANTQLNLNTKGSKKSKPEFISNPGGGLTKTKDFSFVADGAKAKLKDGGKSVQHTITLKKIGKPKKTGFQAQSCGEAAVDIAPGGHYFDDTSYDGTIDNNHKSIKTG